MTYTVKTRNVSPFVHWLVALGILLLMCKGSAASTLFTSILDIETAGTPLNALECNLVNVSKKPLSGDISIIGASGTVLSHTSYNNVAPGIVAGDRIGSFPSATPFILAYCKITVTNAPATSIRGSFTRTDQKGNAAVSVEAR